MNYERISPERLQYLLAMSRDGDLTARSDIVLANMGMIVACYKQVWKSRKTRKSGMRPEDLVNEGVIGGMHAVRCFEPARGYCFSTYFYACVLRSMLIAVDQRGFLIRRPRRQRPGNRPMLVRKSIPYDDEDDAILDPGSDPHAAAERAEIRDAVREAVREFPERTSRILTQIGFEEMRNGWQLADEYGITKQRVYQIYQRAKEELADKLARFGR